MSLTADWIFPFQKHCFFFLKIVSPNSKKLEASIMEVHCYKALHPYPFKHDDICSCMLHRGFTIAVSHEFEFTIYFHVLYNLTSLIYLKVILFSGDTN